MAITRTGRSAARADRQSPGPAHAAPGRSHAHSARGRLAYLDGWRGISIIVVLLGHFVGNVFVAVGHLGVEMFFVLSGRLMAQILFVERFPLREFYRRRIARIFPAMIAFIAISYLLFRNDPFLGARLKLAIAAQGLVYNYVGAAGHRSPVFDHIWSLCIEEHSYILLAILAWIARQGRIRIRPTLLIAAALSMLDGVLSEVLLRQDWWTAYWRTDTHIASILISAWLFLTLRDAGTRVPAWLSPICAMLGALSFANELPEYVSLTLGTVLLAAAIATLDHAWAGYRAALSARALTMAGALSYSVYLWQQPFYQIAVWKLRLPPAQAVPWIVPAIACGVLSYRFVETPSRRWVNRLDLPFLRQRPVSDRSGVRPAAG